MFRYALILVGCDRMTRFEFLDLLKQHNINTDIVQFENSAKDGYLVRKNRYSWEVVFRERGKEFECMGFPSESDALQYLFYKLVPKK